MFVFGFLLNLKYIAIPKMFIFYFAFIFYLFFNFAYVFFDLLFYFIE